METKWTKQGAELLNEIRTLPLAPNETALWYIGQVGYVIRHGRMLIMIDPVLNDMTDENGASRRCYREPFTALEAAALGVDYVICTHGHADHLAPETIHGFLKADPKPVFVIPVGCRKQMQDLGASEEDTVCLKDGLRFEKGSLQITAISTAHPGHVDDPDDPNMALGYEVTLGDDTSDGGERHRIIHLGDTYLTERLYDRLMSMAGADLLLPPINGDDLFRRMRDCIGNMEAEEAAKLAVRTEAKLTIPTHYDMVMGNTVDPRRFADEMDRLGAAEHCAVLRLGEKIILR